VPDAAHIGRADPFDLGGLGPGAAIDVVDYHTAGEPFRIVPGVWPEDDRGLEDWPPTRRPGADGGPGGDGGPGADGGPGGDGGPTVLDRRAWIRDHRDGVRRLCVNEPRGHADMYGAWVVPPDGIGPDGDAVFGAVFFHKDGYSTACGHGAIALATWAVESGRVPVEPESDVSFAIDVPSGRVRVRAKVRGGLVRSVAFRNVPAWVAATGLAVETSLGQVVVDVSYGGAFYASARAGDLGLSVRPDHLDQLMAVGREIKWALNSHPSVRHPEDDRLSGMYGAIWWEDLPGGADSAGRGGGIGQMVQRNVTIFADGEVDRSPCGSGTSARLALLAWEGRLAEAGAGAARPPAPPAELRHLSIVGTAFTGRVLGPGPAIETPAGPRPTYLTEVEGRASQTGRATLVLGPDDELGLGFQLR
jgi:proline racemase